MTDSLGDRAQADTDEGQEACDRLGVEVLPTLQFWRDGAKLWEHRGIVELDQDLAEGARAWGAHSRVLVTCTCCHLASSGHLGIVQQGPESQLPVLWPCWLARLHPSHVEECVLLIYTVDPCSKDVCIQQRTSSAASSDLTGRAYSGVLYYSGSDTLVQVMLRPPVYKSAQVRGWVFGLLACLRATGLRGVASLEW